MYAVSVLLIVSRIILRGVGVYFTSAMRIVSRRIIYVVSVFICVGLYELLHVSNNVSNINTATNKPNATNIGLANLTSLLSIA